MNKLALVEKLKEKLIKKEIFKEDDFDGECYEDDDGESVVGIAPIYSDGHKYLPDNEGGLIVESDSILWEEPTNGSGEVMEIDIKQINENNVDEICNEFVEKLLEYFEENDLVVSEDEDWEEE